MSVTIAIVGRPNVGKSRLFNALLGKKAAIVHDQPGVTRDPNIADIAPGLTLVDTGGWGLSQVIKGLNEEAELIQAVEDQVTIAAQEAQKILFVVDGRAGMTSIDAQITDWLRHHKEKVIVVVNKVDQDDTPFDEGEFTKLGFPLTWITSAEHNRGIDTLKSRLMVLAPKNLPKPTPEELALRRPAVCIIGRPNVGKSSLINALMQSPRMIISPVSGTTRDPAYMDMDYKGKKGDIYRFRLVDTAGLRHRTKVGSPVEVFSQIRTRQALEKTDLAILVLDAQDGVTTQDKLLAGEIIKTGKALVVAVNKWDLAAERFKEGKLLEGYESLQDFEAACRKDLTGALFFTEGTPFVFMSAKEGLNLEKLLAAAQTVEAAQDKTWSTPDINKLLNALLWKNIPRNKMGKFFRVYYATQTGHRPYSLKLFCNQIEGINDSFKRYLTRGFAEEFGVQGCPIFFDFISKPKRPMPENKPNRTLKPRQKLRLSRSKTKKSSKSR